MIIPLGFGRSLPEKPWLSIAVCALICAVSIPFISKLSNFQVSMEHSPDLVSFLQIQEKFTKQNCEQLSGHTAACRIVEQILKGRISSKKNSQTDGINPQQFLTLAPQERKFIFTWLSGLQQPEKFEKIVGLQPENRADLDQAAELIKAYQMGEYAKLGILTPVSRSPLAATLSFLAHGGWMHLVGNLLLLFFFMRVLESRFPRSAMVVLLSVGGLGGLYFELWVRFKDVPAILGASSGVAALMGCFWVTFFSQQIQILFLNSTTRLGKQKIYLPVSWSIPLFIFLVDVVGVFSSRFSETNVAHWAHLSGFIIGTVAGLLLKNLYSLPKGILFPREQKNLNQIKAANDSSQVTLDLCEKVIDWNPDQVFALRAGLKICFQEANKESQFVLKRFPDFLQLCQKKKLDQSCLQVFNLVPMEYNSKKILEKVNLTTLNWLGRIFLDNGNWWLALSCYSVIAEKHENSKSSGPVYETIQKLVTFGLEHPENLPLLAKWLRSIHHPTLRQLIECDFPQILSFLNRELDPKRLVA